MVREEAPKNSSPHKKSKKINEDQENWKQSSIYRRWHCCNHRGTLGIRK